MPRRLFAGAQPAQQDVEMTAGAPLLLSSYARPADYTGAHANSGRVYKTGNGKAEGGTASKLRTVRAWFRRHACALFSSFVALALVLAAVILPIMSPQVLDSIYDSAACPACLALLFPLQAMARRGDEAFTELVVGFCIQFRVSSPMQAFTTHNGARMLIRRRDQIQDEDVCSGAVRSQAPILAHVLRTISPGSSSYRKICSSLLEMCAPPPLNQITLNFTSPPVPALAAKDATSPVRIKKEWISRGRRPFQVAHLSDVHVDRKYAVSACRLVKNPAPA